MPTKWTRIYLTVYHTITSHTHLLSSFTSEGTWCKIRTTDSNKISMLQVEYQGTQVNVCKSVLNNEFSDGNEWGMSVGYITKQFHKKPYWLCLIEKE